MKKDIEGRREIVQFVDAFYEHVRHDDLLSPIFRAHIPGDWQPHLDVMYGFWDAALFGTRGYVGNPFAKHASIPLTARHFNRWLSIFNHTLDNLFSGAVCEDAKKRAQLMASNFLRRLTQPGYDAAKTIV